MTPCPHCKHPMVDDVIVDVPNNTLRHGDKTLRLTPMQTEIVHVLQCHAPAAVDQRKLITLVYGALGACEKENRDEDAVLKVQICRLRKSLASWPFTIETVWGKGYRYVTAAVPA